MNQTTKVTYLAWAVHDYYKKEEDLPEPCQGRKIDHLPGFREYFSYTFTFIGYCGPFVDYKDYMDFIYVRGNYQSIRVSVVQFIKNILLLILCNGIFLAFKSYFVFTDMGTEEFGTYGI